MIRFFILSLMMMGVTLSVAPMAYAQDATVEATTEEAETPSIADMLAEVEFLTKAKPKKKVSVYSMLRSHYNCGFCRKITPDLITAYKAMKGKGAEIILLSADSDVKVAEDWAKEAGMTYPIVTNATTDKVKVPAGGSGGYPNITVVSADGNVLDNASGATACTELVKRWKEFVKDTKKAEKAKKTAAKKAAKAKKAEASLED